MNTKQLLIIGLLATGITGSCVASDTQPSSYISKLITQLKMQPTAPEKMSLFMSKISSHHDEFMARLDLRALGDRSIFQHVFAPEFKIEEDHRINAEATKLWLSYVIYLVIIASQGNTSQLPDDFLPRTDIGACIHKYELQSWLTVNFECFLPGITLFLTNPSAPIPLYELPIEEESTSASSDSSDECSYADEFSVSEDDTCGLRIDGLRI